MARRFAIDHPHFRRALGEVEGEFALDLLAGGKNLDGDHR
jgi:hypothetical protein